MALSSSQVLTLDKTSLETGKRGNSPTGLFTQKDKPCSFLIMNFISLSYKTVTRVDHMYHLLFNIILGSFTPHCFSVTYSGDTSLIASWSPLQLNLSQGSVWNIYRSPRAARPLAKKPVAVIPQILFLFSFFSVLYFLFFLALKKITAVMEHSWLPPRPSVDQKVRTWRRSRTWGHVWGSDEVDNRHWRQIPVISEGTGVHCKV